MRKYLDKPTGKDIAVSMWIDGFDTYEIALRLNIRESIVYNMLPVWRAAIKSARAA